MANNKAFILLVLGWPVLMRRNQKSFNQLGGMRSAKVQCTQSCLVTRHSECLITGLLQVSMEHPAMMQTIIWATCLAQYLQRSIHRVSGYGRTSGHRFKHDQPKGF